MARRERTRQLIELGGLVQKAGLVDIADDDRALLYGAFLAVAQRLGADDGSQLKLLYRRRGAYGRSQPKPSKPPSLVSQAVNSKPSACCEKGAVTL